MLSFENDYAEGAHEEILAALARTNREQTSGYGTDPYCAAAQEKIRAACRCPAAQVRFLVGGTQANQVVIDAMLRPYEGVVAAQTGHVNTHEAGAIEYTGHKVLSLPAHEGKMDAGELADFLRTWFGDENREHTVHPGMVYISYPTEYGTLYSKAELTALHETCAAYGLPLFIDGARLGYGLAAASDMTLPDIAALCEVFYIGGTKVGALCGEAVVFTKDNLPPHFVSIVKQHGALLAKGRVLGIQFDTLFTDDLYGRISREAIRTADALRALLHEKGYRLYLENPTNQIFVVLPDETLARLAKDVKVSFWEKADATHTVVRFATSWATTPENVDALIALL